MASAFETKAKYAILMEATTGHVLFEKNADELMHPASMSKLVTLGVVFDALKKGQLKLSTTFTVSEHAWRTGGAPSGTSAMFVPIHSDVTLEDLIQGITVQSGNDACIIIAEGMSGSVAAFAQRMTRYARSIGMTKSTFANPTGLPDPHHLMTVRELGILAMHLIHDYPKYYHFFGEKIFKYRIHTFYNRNPLIYFNDGTDGLKTGYTKESGYGLVASTEREGRRLITVVNGLSSKKEREEEAKKLVDWGFNAFRKYTLYDPGETVGEALVWGGTQRYVPLVGDDGVKLLLPTTSARDIKASIIYDGPLKPPIKRGDQVAVLRVEAPNTAANDIPLYASENVGRGSIFTRGFDSLLNLAFGWLL